MQKDTQCRDSAGRVISEPTSRFLLRITGLIVLVRYSMLIGLILNLWNVCVSSKSLIQYVNLTL